MVSYRIIVTDDRYEDYTEENMVLKEIGAQVEVHDFKDSADAISVLKNADAVLCNLFPLGPEIIFNMNKCKVISRYGVGFDNIDIKSATDRNILVTNVPDYSVEDVSDQTLALLMGCIRKISYKDNQIRKGAWNLHKIQPCYRIKGKILGLIGFGHIAQALCRKVKGFGLQSILAYDPYVTDDIFTQTGAIKSKLNDVLKNSDFISIHVPLNENTKLLIDKDTMQKMRSGVILINTSRGPVINETDLFDNLKTHKIGYAGLDVFCREPLPEDSPLRTLDNIIFSDHAGWYSEESIVELKIKAAKNILKVLKGEVPIYLLNEEVLHRR